MSQVFSKSDYTKAISDLNLKKSSLDLTKTGPSQEGAVSFVDHLQASVESVDQMQKSADKMAVAVSSGKSEDIHGTMLALTQAELGFNLMVQVRNKALEAYQEIMRLPV